MTTLDSLEHIELTTKAQAADIPSDQLKSNLKDVRGNILASIKSKQYREAFTFRQLEIAILERLGNKDHKKSKPLPEE